MAPVSLADPIPRPADPPPHDPAALHRLVVDHGDAVYRLALSVVRDKALAEDIAQETMLKAWMALPTLRDQASIRGWVLRIANNTAISTLRARQAIAVDPHDLPEAEAPTTARSRPGFRATPW